MRALVLRTFCLLVAVLSISLVPARGAGAQPVTAIRVLDSRLASTLHHAAADSPTLRSLIAELERSDAIVHVTALSVDGRHSHAGQLSFVTTAAARRFLRIAVDPRLPYEWRAAMLGHELHHAVEVVREPAVVDQMTFAALYRRLGRPSGDDPRCFDTAGAREAGDRVLAEVRGLTTAPATRAGAATGR